MIALWKDCAVVPRNSGVSTKIWNVFLSPASFEIVDCVGTCNVDGEFECLLKIGSKLYPEYPIQSYQESYIPIYEENRSSIIICS